MSVRTHLQRPRAFEGVLFISQVILAGSSVLVARSSGAYGRGLLTTVTVWTQVLGWFGVFSLEKALMVMSRPPRSEFSPEEGMFAAARLVRRLSGPAMVLGFAVAVFLLHDWVLGAVMASGIVVTAHVELWYGFLLATGQRSTYLALRLAQPAIYALGIALVAQLGAGLSAPDKVYLMTVGFLVSLIAPSGISFLRSRPDPPHVEKGRPVRLAMFAFARGAQFASVLQYLNARLDLLALPLKVSATRLGLYAVGAAPAQVLIYFGSAGSFRGLTGEAKDRDLPALIVVAGLAGLVAVSAPFAIPLVFGNQFTPSVPVAQVLSLGAFFGFALQMASGRLLGNSRARALTFAQGLGAITFLLGFLMADTIVEVAWASTVSYFVSLLLAEFLLAQPLSRIQSGGVAHLSRVVILCDYYLPGFRAGGPIRSISGLVAGLAGSIEFRVISRDRDLSEATPYPNVDTQGWTNVAGTEVQYLSPRQLTLRGIRSAILASPHEVLYLNSFFSPQFTIKPLLLRKLGLVPRDPVVVLAPRGEFSPAALSLEWGKKRIFIAAARLLGLYRGVLWQASTTEEEHLIREAMGERLKIKVAEVVVAGDVPVAEPLPPPSWRHKASGSLRVVTVSRITRMKNQLTALHMLADVEGDVIFDLYGPIDDQRYYSEIVRQISRMPPNVRARYMGELPHNRVAETLGAYDLFLLPTLGENFGHAIREALSAGCPVLISDRAPWHGLLDAGAGWDLPLETPGLFSECLQQCVLMDARQHGGMREQAHAYARRLVDRDPSLQQNRQLFEVALEMYRAKLWRKAEEAGSQAPPPWMEES